MKVYSHLMNALCARSVILATAMIATVAASDAMAAVTVLNVAQWVGFGSPAVTVDFNSDASAEIGFSDDGITVYGLAATNVRIMAVPATPPDLGSWAFPLSPGTEIGPTAVSGSQWVNETLGAGVWGCADTGSGITTCYGLWPPSQFIDVDPGTLAITPRTYAFLGVQFDLADGTHYGWVQIGVINNLNGAYVFRGAYETQPNTPIFAGSVPEPARAMLWLAGMAVHLFRRRRD